MEPPKEPTKGWWEAPGEKAHHNITITSCTTCTNIVVSISCSTNDRTISYSEIPQELQVIPCIHLVMNLHFRVSVSAVQNARTTKMNSILLSSWSVLMPSPCQFHTKSFHIKREHYSTTWSRLSHHYNSKVISLTTNCAWNTWRATRTGRWV